MLEGFYIVWLDNEGEEILDEWIYKPTYDMALQSAGRRLSQSPHRVPQDAGGFYIEHPLHWRERHKLETPGEPKLSKAEFDKLQDELSAKYGPPPFDEDQET